MDLKINNEKVKWVNITVVMIIHLPLITRAAIFILYLLQKREV